jgi:Flp pilus assembly protein TadG
MKFTIRSKQWRTCYGQSLVEFAIVLPILLMLLLGVVDHARAILFNNILINMSREGANLAARSAQTSQFIIAALNFSAIPLNMPQHGMVYITRVSWVDDGAGNVVAQVDEQYRATSGNGNLSLPSRLWSCPSWDASTGKCNLPASAQARIVTVALPLPAVAGSEARIAETIYHYTPLTTYVMKNALELYSWTLL